ncbi:uncharacterized protein JCM6883_003643 [Sporobolomyces salmoneus]|uniref:uncharacterized protein n=1 Tax=Sporobolomyces salmoneus TaxID=183962 RepID=UPI00316BB2E3
MFSSLPPELVRDIIESTVPHTYHSTTYDARQATLCTLSLVSRQFRAIAQPLLFEIVDLKSEAQLKLLAEAKDKTWRFKELIVSGQVPSEAVQALVGRQRGLKTCNIERFSNCKEPSIDLSDLVQYPKLHNLQIGGRYNCSIGGPILSLRSLTIDYQCQGSPVVNLLNPKVLPSLRALGLNWFEDPEELRQLAKTNLSQLLPQLEAIVVHNEFYLLAMTGLLSGYAPRILADVYYDSNFALDSTQLLASVHHLRILVSRRNWSFSASRQLSESIAAHRESETLSLKSLYLDLSLQPSRVETPDLCFSTLGVERVMGECKRSGIELVFEAQPENDEDSYISHEFWTRQRRRREKE